MTILTSLPIDVLQCILPLLEKNTLSKLAQTCQLFYALARPLLFKHVKIRLNTYNGRIDRWKLQRDLEMLERIYRGQKIAELVQSLSVLSDDAARSRSDRRPWDAMSTGFAAGLVTLLRCLPILKHLIIDRPPNILRPKTSEHTSQYSALSEQLKQASQGFKLKFVGSFHTAAENRAWWLRLLLGSLAEHLVELEVYVAIDCNIRDPPAPFALSLSSLPVLKTLWMSGGDSSTPAAALLDCVVSQCPQLHCMELVYHIITLSNFQNIFGNIPTLRTLVLRMCNVFEVQNMGLALSQSQPLHFSVLDCELESFFWLSHLPGTLVDFCYCVQTYNWVPPAGRTLLEVVYDKLSACFRAPSWCPNLASLDIRIEGDMRGRDGTRCEERELDLREALLRDLRCHRKQLIRINPEFWIHREPVTRGVISDSEDDQDEAAPAPLMG